MGGTWCVCTGAPWTFIQYGLSVGQDHGVSTCWLCRNLPSSSSEENSLSEKSVSNFDNSSSGPLLTIPRRASNIFSLIAVAWEPTNSDTWDVCPTQTPSQVHTHSQSHYLCLQLHGPPPHRPLQSKVDDRLWSSNVAHHMITYIAPCDLPNCLPRSKVATPNILFLQLLLLQEVGYSFALVVPSKPWASSSLHAQMLATIDNSFLKSACCCSEAAH